MRERRAQKPPMPGQDESEPLFEKDPVLRHSTQVIVVG